MRLDHEPDGSAGGEGLAEGGDHRPRIFALLGRVEVVGEEEQKCAGRQGEPGADVAPGHGKVDGVRHGQHRLRQFGRDRGAGEFGGTPDFVEELVLVHPGVGKLRQLPRPVRDVVMAGAKRGSMVMVEVAADRRIQVKDVYRIRIGLLQAGRERVVIGHGEAVQLQLDQRCRQTDGITRLRHATRGLAEAEGAAEPADHVHATRAAEPA